MLSNFNNLYRVESSQEVLDFVERLCTEHQEFHTVFGDGMETLLPDQKEELYTKFRELYPHESLDEIISKYKNISVPDPCVDADIWDPQTKKIYNPTISKSTKRSKPNDFNLADFLIKEQEENRCINIHFDETQEEYYDLQNLSFEEKKKCDSATENSLHQIAKIALILNDFKELPYQVLAVRADERIL